MADHMANDRTKSLLKHMQSLLCWCGNVGIIKSVRSV